MERDWALTQADFDALLAWLDPDRERAAVRYEEIRSRLGHIFICRGSPNAEELADQTIDRVTRKLAGFSEPYSGNPALYFYGVAKHIFHESLRTHVVPSPRNQTPAGPVEENDAPLECLEKCMQELPPESRRLILSYFEQRGQAKIEQRKQLAAELGIDMNALRIRAHRIRARLEKCVRKCIDETK